MTSRPAHRLLSALLLTLLVLAGCGTPGPGRQGSSSATGSSAGAAPGGTVIVLAAASLTGAFTELGRRFEAAHPGSRVVFSFGSSATLATQVTQGAPADVFAAASPATMRTVTDAGAAMNPTTFVTNTLEIAVPPGNPGRISGLADFADARRRFAVCAEQVPCGAAAATVFRAAGVQARPDTYEQDVKAALQKVVADEVDAALVYRTDVLAAGPTVEGIEFPEAAEAVNAYPVAVLEQSRNPAGAAAFVAYVLSEEAQQVLGEAGFGRP